jgi:membrane peptidoglycan carboxypeptidase
MDTAVLICEDGRFYAHNGFDQEAIRNSIRENLKAGRFMRGASTISMQLAKNLYLPRDKTLSRKLQEAVLTQLLEQQLTKDEIMELYLNVIEFGPGIYGIGAAAAHYFNAAPHQLFLGQSLYLASVLPSPKRHYFGADGRVTPGWMGYLRKLMRIGVKIRRVTDAELADALQEEVTFKVPYSPRIPSEDSPDPEADPFEETSTPAPMN